MSGEQTRGSQVEPCNSPAAQPATLPPQIGLPFDQSYLPLSHYGLIGDCRTAALVSTAGSIDWLCVPDFDSPSIFARLIDARRGGHFFIRPVAEFESQASYLGDSAAVVRTVFRTVTGRVALADFMPLHETGDEDRFGKPRTERRLIRIVEGLDGEMKLIVDFRPRPGYGSRAAKLDERQDGVSLDAGEGVIVLLRSSMRIAVDGESVLARFSVCAGETAAFVLDWSGDADYSLSDCPGRALDETLTFWREWHQGCRYRGPYYDSVMRSLATLKLLNYAPSGAMVAAPTTSVPEAIGGVRNWDYRYTWIRDASLAFRALLQAGHPEDARRYMRWLCETALRCSPGDLQIMYGLRGERDLRERTLDHLEGYVGSKPVHTGNAACTQFQLDVYGELLDCFDLVRRSGVLPPDEIREIWPAFAGQVDVAATRWCEPDSGIWEMRNEPRHFVLSKVMAWVALDRGIKAAEDAALPVDLRRWKCERDAVREEVMRRGYSELMGTFVQSYGSQSSDAANLLLLLFGFLPASHPRVRSTVDAIMRTLMRDGLVYRYRGTDDGVPGDESAFAACTFWLVENLAEMGRKEQAIELFESMLARQTPFGLYAEQIDPRTGTHLGNFPQALSHIGLINAADALARAGTER